MREATLRVHVVMARGMVAAIAVAVIAGLVMPVTAVASPAVGLRPASAASATELPETTQEEKVKAAAVLGIVAGDDLLILSDKDFVFEIWKRAGPKPEVKAAALAAHESGDE